MDKKELNELLEEALEEKSIEEVAYTLRRIKNNNHKPGRTNKYYTNVQPHLKKITEFYGKGMTKSAIATKLDVSREALFHYINEHQELAEAFDKAKKQQLDLVEGALFKACVGETREVEKVKVLSDGEIVRYTETEIKDADVQAIKFYLPNRDPEKWASKINIEVSKIDEFFEDDK